MRLLIAFVCVLAAAPGASLDNAFFVFDNGAGRGELPLEQQAQLIRETGYAGVGYSGTERIPEMLKALDERGLKMFSIYAPVDDPGLPEAIGQLKGRQTLLLLTLQKEPAGGRRRAVELVREAAALAANAGLRVALYPHFGFYIGKVSEALELARESGRKNVGIMFNLCHWLKEGEAANLQPRLREALPFLYAVSINGADHEGDWDRLIQPLDAGDFDVYGFMRTLVDMGFRGPVGLQCYNVKGDRRENLVRSMATWRRFAVRMSAPPAAALPHTAPLTMEGDLAARMVAGINRWLDRETAAAPDKRARFWSAGVEPNRERLRKMVGAVDTRVASRLEIEPLSASEPAVAQGPRYSVYAVRWQVLEGVSAEGLLLEPQDAPRMRVVAIPDADWSPEMLAGLAPGLPPEAQWARRLAENGCQVLVPAIIDRRDTWSGIPWIRMTNQPHREWIYRMAYEVGRHIVGYEVQRVLAGIDWFEKQNGANAVPLAVAGSGEGGLLALYSAALDKRISTALVSGYFQARREIWKEPIYRDVWGLGREFGDAEIARLVAPRALIIDAGAGPEIPGPPSRTKERGGAAPNGSLSTPPPALVREEVERARSAGANVRLAEGDAIAALLGVEPRPGQAAASDKRANYDPSTRLRRQFDELVGYTQTLVRQSPRKRAEFWAKADSSTPERWRESTRFYRDYLWDEVIGRMPPPSLPGNPRARLVYDQPKFRGYEVVLDVWPDVFAYGILLVPKDIKPGERRPAVVCQHGLEGRPTDVADPNFESPYYHRYAVKLAEEGFVTFAPQNPYIGEDRFRIIQRKAHPLKLALFSFILGQHQRILEWLGAQPFVDASRIGFYGLSYGGKTAVRVPPFLDGYALSICSADFNEWVWKTTSVDAPYSYMITGEYDMYEFDFANRVNYGELANLMAPRLFMVERGHADGVAPDEWVAYEFAKVRRFYATRMKMPDRARIEFFDGPHSIHGAGTFEFLRKHLRHAKPEGR